MACINSPDSGLRHMNTYAPSSMYILHCIHTRFCHLRPSHASSNHAYYNCIYVYRAKCVALLCRDTRNRQSRMHRLMYMCMKVHWLIRTAFSSLEYRLTLPCNIKSDLTLCLSSTTAIPCTSTLDLNHSIWSVMLHVIAHTLHMLSSVHTFNYPTS